MNGTQLKNSILQWAIQGKLVEQLPKEGSASDLYEKILAEKQALIKAGKLKKEKPLPPISLEDIPFEIPKEWKWCRIGDIFTLQAGKNIASSEIYNSKSKEHQYPCYGGNGRRGYVSTYNRAGHFCIIGRQGALCGNVNFANGTFYATEHAVVVDVYSNVDVSWSGIFLSALNLNQYATATAQPGLAVANINKVLIPLPPIGEQKRIVAKLEKLLPLIDEFSAAQEQLDKLNKELPEALKKSILQEAIQGKLVSQNPKDEPASVLLAKIQKEKEALVKQGKLKKKDLESTPINEEEIPFEIPETWTWCRLDNLGTFVRGNGIKRDETVSTGKPCVRYGEMYTTYRVKFSDIKSHTTSNIFDKCQKFHKDDILMALTGENKWDIALAAVYQGDEEVALGGDMCRFTPFECNSLYLVYLINSPYGIGYKRETSTGDIIVHTSTSKLGNFLVPLPPLAEQKRIVAKLEQLFKVL